MNKFHIIILLLVGTVYADPIENNFPKEEIIKIEDAIKRNGGMRCPDLRLIVYAIRKVENGGKGKEFGIMSPKAKDFNSQAGWCVCTVNKNYDRWLKSKKESFISYLGKKYSPIGVKNDPNDLNKNWIPNLLYWHSKFI